MDKVNENNSVSYCRGRKVGGSQFWYLTNESRKRVGEIGPRVI